MNKSQNSKSISAADFRRRKIRSFGAFFAFLVVCVFGLFAIQWADLDRSLQWPLRKVLDWNAQLGFRIVNTERIDPPPASIPPSKLHGKKARTNGDAGLTSPLNLKDWRVTVVKESGLATTSSLVQVYDLAAIQMFPKQEITVEFKCIEGWSEIMSFGGTRFIDFVNQFGLATKSGSLVDTQARPDDLYKYVGLETPDGEYFVSLDMKSALNPQTLLAYEQNGVPLTSEHGAPLRLYIPNKYGVKSLKRIGKITFTDVRPRDYWEEDGYDWFAGL